MKETLRKIICLLAVLTCTVTFTGCNITINTGDKSSEKTEKSEDVKDKAEEDAEETEEAEEKETEAPEKETKTEFEAGTISGQTYTSDFAGVTIKIPDDWKFKSESDLDSLEDEVTEWDVWAESSSGSSLAICVETLSISTITVEKYISILEGMVEEQYKTQGLTVDEVKTTETTTIAGETYNIFELALKSNGMKMTQRYYIRKIGKYMVSILGTTIDGITETQEDLLGFIN